jgi:hypothetical protein
MLRSVAVGALAAASVGCLPYGEKQTIVVDGEGVVMAKPDSFTVTAELHALGSDETQILKQVSQGLDRVMNSLPQLAGLESTQIETATVSLTPVYERECFRTSDYTQRDACPVEARKGSVTLKVIGAPAESAGDAMSFLSELGASEVNLIGFGVSNIDEVESAATEAALKDAESKARRLARAAGLSLGRMTRAQYGSGFYEDRPYYASARPLLAVREPPAAADDRVAPEVSLVLSPQPFEVREKVTAAFALREPS